MKKLLVCLLSLLLLLSSGIFLSACGGCGGCDGGGDESGAKPYVMVDERTIKFGKYPQTAVKEMAVIEQLLALAGNPLENTEGWTSYNYYVNYQVSNCMYYKDVELNGEKYRGVYIDDYRPYRPHISSTTNNSRQYENGYYDNSVYWFKYELIEWTILENTDGTAFILSKMVLDSQEFDYKIEGGTSNNYKESAIRKWLNQTFYNTAFNDKEQSIIQTTEVANGVETTRHNPNDCVCENTFDKVFLLSYAEAKNTAYGFNDKDNENNLAREKAPSDYANAQGCNNYEQKANWWLRSPDKSAHYARGVNYKGNLDAINDNYFNVMGVVPAVKIKL